MQKVLDNFNERAKEVTRYIKFLSNLELSNINLSENRIASEMDNELESENMIVSEMDNELEKILLEKTLKATSYLLLYNLVESTMRNAIEFIFEEIKNNNISFDDLSDKLKKIIWDNIKKRGTEQLTTKVIQLTTDIIDISFDVNDLFSGNVDAKRIREVAESYGFSAYTDNSKTKGGFDLLNIKKNRNDLAHGFVPFGDVGKDITASELVEISKRVIEYLRQILNNINDYLVNQEYLRST